ncbi:MAG: DNA-binding MarR family transcriptional regulator [Bacteroidia bacterium]|jgi:DNA-binding MarR family transcriptional regulator
MIEGLNKIFESRVRLGIMSSLMVNDWLDFNTIKELLDVTDGNLSSHMTALEKAEYTEVRKEFVGKRPKTTFRVTIEGRKAFSNHINALEELIRNTQ